MDTKALEKRKPIGSYTISNTGGLLVYEIDYSEDRVLVGVFTDHLIEADWVPIIENCIDNSHECAIGFCWGEQFIPFSEVIRV